MQNYHLIDNLITLCKHLNIHSYIYAYMSEYFVELKYLYTHCIILKVFFFNLGMVCILLISTKFMYLSARKLATSGFLK